MQIAPPAVHPAELIRLPEAFDQDDFIFELKMDDFGPDLHRSVEPIARFAASEIKVAVAPRQLGALAARGEFLINGL
jgi:hypothetical protein